VILLITGGGITVELDAVSFELFTSAVELYCRNPNAIKLFDFNKVIAKDKGGRQVQYTFQIFDAPSLSYTINAYSSCLAVSIAFLAFFIFIYFG
jgi:hypothetical protein